MKKEVFIVLLFVLAIFANAQETSELAQIEEIKQDLKEKELKINELESRFTEQLQQENQMPKALFVFYLLGVNLILLVFVIILLFYFYRKYIKKRYGLGEIHPVPEELIDYVYKSLSKKNMQEIRMELAKKGWSPSIIEHAIDAAKEK